MTLHWKSRAVFSAAFFAGAALAPFAHADIVDSGLGKYERAFTNSALLSFSDTRSVSDPSAVVTPILNAELSHGGQNGVPGRPVAFQAFWNYDRAVAGAFIRIFDETDVHLSRPLAEIAFTREDGASWILPATGSGRYRYTLRVHATNGVFDETAPRPLIAATTKVDLTPLDPMSRSSLRSDNTAIRAIALQPLQRSIAAIASTTSPGEFTTPATQLPTTIQVPVVLREAPVLRTAPPVQILVGSDYQASALGADHVERSADDEFMQTGILMSFDGLNAQPMLNAGLTSGRSAGVPGSAVEFSSYWNYDAWIERAEIEIRTASNRSAAMPPALVPVDRATGKATWTMPDGTAGATYTYVLRVHGKDGRFDETKAKSLSAVPSMEASGLVPHTAGPIYGEDATQSRQIDVRGGAVTVSGKGSARKAGAIVEVMGRRVDTDAEGDFAYQQILPTGQHDISVKVTGPDGAESTTTRTANIPDTDLFLVAIGDLTIGTRSSDSRALLEAAGEEFESTYVTGRAAFYLKGKIKGRYLITASMDTTEDDIDSLFSNLAEKDPQSILRRIDPDRYYPVYGDNSNYVDDAPTQGRFYVRLEDGDDHLVWGNFFSDINSTEFAQIDRGLYGAKAEYNSETLSINGDSRVQATVFAADPGSLPGRQEFRATGGSVYFLENQDLLIGSERLRIEIRDETSGLVFETRDLLPFIDYEIDYIQGRLVLSQPLASTEIGEQIVRDGTLSGRAVYLVTRYEYVPAISDIDGYSTGGRGEVWVNDAIRLGVTALSEKTASADQLLTAVDVLARKSDTTYVKAEIAQTDGVAFDERSSIDGGFNFAPLTSGLDPEAEALAWRIEAGVDVRDFIEAAPPVRLTGYAEELETGFSATGRLTPAKTQRAGFTASGQLNSAVDATLKADTLSVEDTFEESTASGDVRVKLDEAYELGLGLRYNNRDGALPASDGHRLDAGAELRYQATDTVIVYGFAQATIDAAASRDAANRVGLGLKARVLENIVVNGEVSDGSGGLGALAGLSWQRRDGEEYYLNYSLDADRTEPGVDGTNTLINADNALTLGARTRFSEALSVYGEERASFGDRAGLTHAYGVDFRATDQWTFGATLEAGALEDRAVRVEREAFGLSSGYSSEGINFGAAFEWRTDKEGGQARDTWLFRSNLGVKISPDWSSILKYSKAESNFSGGAFFDGDFTDLSIAGAYRPVTNDRLNALVRAGYFEDLPSASQVSSSGQSALPAQKSYVFSADGNYRLTEWLTLGGKIGYRDGEISLTREEDDFIGSTARLAILRADVHFTKKWDGLIEARHLDVSAARDSQAGFLAAIYRHVGENAKVGIGYNFTDFSDSLTDLTYDDRGIFLNLVAAF